VSGDREDLRRALWNLVENALKYTRPDGPGRMAQKGRAGGPEHVWMGLDRRGEIAVLTVRDTGIGIAHSDLPFVFDRFWRAQEVRGTPGTGLGLAIVRRVASAHGGSIQVRSTLGKGTTFVLRVPLTAAPELPGDDAPGDDASGDGPAQLPRIVPARPA